MAKEVVKKADLERLIERYFERYIAEEDPRIGRSYNTDLHIDINSICIVIEFRSGLVEYQIRLLQNMIKSFSKELEKTTFGHLKATTAYWQLLEDDGSEFYERYPHMVYVDIANSYKVMK